MLCQLHAVLNAVLMQRKMPGFRLHCDQTRRQLALVDALLSFFVLGLNVHVQESRYML